MHIEKMVVNNFRLLKDFEVNLENDMSLVIGKNNTGKTSLLTVLESFLIGNKNTFSFEDINLEARNSFKKSFQQDDFEENFRFGTSLKLYIAYNEEDDLSNISSLMLNLSPDQNVVVIEFSYLITYEEVERLEEDYNEEKPDSGIDILSYLKENHKKYFKIRKRALEYNNEENFVEIDDSRVIDKIINLRVFDDEDGKMNLSAKDLNRDIMVISQFTLYGDCRSGRRPGYSEAASPGKAEELYDYFIDKIKNTELKIANGEFKAYMNVSLNNDGPVTLLIDSKKKF